MELLYINWNPDIVAFSIGSFAVRWYSICWCAGLLAVYLLEARLYKEQKIPDEKFEPLFLYCFIGILIGARLGHCLFYEPGYYLTHPLEMILPMKKDAMGGWHFTGYEGLASHGGTLGLLAGLWLFVRRSGLKALTVLDNIAIVTPVCACAIRLGNLMNSEIIGRPTDVPWAFIFERIDNIPRHPGQLYEALCYALFFVVGWVIYKRNPEKVGTGFFFGLCLTLIFLSRILIEWVKENQVDFENGMFLNMGQLLSIPFVIVGVWCMVRGNRKEVKSLKK
ncbi:MAG: prolipoprotein diacylglyceryl transferase [Prevotellaceae bacterium]|nr:prolipoprotein diacylglyceryl transferase [Prevotellaceae bacterium]